MPRWIRCQDQTYMALPKHLEFILCIVLEEVVLLFEQLSDGSCCMEILLHSLVMVINRTVSHPIHVVRVGETIVHIVVTSGCDNEHKFVKLLQFSYVVQVALYHEKVCHVCNIRSMQIIVILHLIVVSDGYASQELDKLLVFDLGLA